MGSQSDEQLNNVMICSLMPEVIGCLRRDLEALEPDFLLVTGDLAHESTRDAMFAARDLMDSLDLPYYPTGGEYDFASPEAREWFLEVFSSRLPGAETYYSFTHKNLHVCVLDPWWRWPDGALCPFRCTTGEECGWVVPPHQFDWLKADLDAHRASPTVLAMHHPVTPTPERLQRNGCRQPGHVENGDLLLETLAAFPQVKAVFSGHVHMNYIVQHEGLIHVASSAMAEYPVEYREVVVADDHLEIRTLGLSEALFATQSLIEGNEWVAGEEQDRAIRIDF
ncbi:MAG: metallophosphoesterase [Candidatus Hydrogenedentes bacterium]|nr:metallophosphoesterase [Candidatus Hydrogenedentota bacterium]